MTYDTINDARTIAGNAEGTLLAGRYRIVRQLGQGGMGSVWLAEDTQLDNKPFAIKMLPSILVSNKRAFRQLKDEALVAMQLVHPNIVQIRAFEENNGNPFLVMDYVDGQTLDDYLAEHFPADATPADVARPPRPCCKGEGALATSPGTTGVPPVAHGLPEADVLRILKPIAAALDYAHKKGVVHRDVKPGNVMIAKDGTPYILDFGIAREIQETLTRVTGKLSSGTLLYMSPEQLMGEPSKPAQDVYSFAAMVYECLKGEPPFSHGQIEFQIMNKQPEPPPGGTQLVASVMSGLAKKPADRPPTCSAVLEGDDFSHKERKERKDAGRSRLPRPPQADMPRHVEPIIDDPIIDDPIKEWGQEPFRRVSKRRVGVVGSLVASFAAVLVVITTCAVYFKSPRIFEAKSEFTMDLRRRKGDDGIGAVGSDRDSYGATYEEIFNTRLSDWRSAGVFSKVIQQYRTNYPDSTVTDKDLIGMLSGSELELVRHSRLITIAVRSKSPELAASLANAYAEAIESFTDEENKMRCDKAVAQIHQQVEKQKRVDDDLSVRLLKFRTENNFDNLKAEQAILNQRLQTTAADVLKYEKRVTAANEWVKALQAAQETPEKFGELPSEVPRSSDIAAAYTKQQTLKMELATLKTHFTPDHPKVVALEGELTAVSMEFGEIVKRAQAIAQGDLTSNQNQLDSFKQKRDSLNKDIADIEQKIIQADAGLKQLDQEKKVSSEIYQDLLQKENEHRIAAEQNNEIVRVGRPAQVPTKPVLPNPKVLFGAGGVLLLIIAAAYAVFHGMRAGKGDDDQW